MSLAEATREEGNGHFKVGAFVLAERCYADALALLTAEATAVSAACAVVDDVTVIETICKPVADSTGAAAASEAIADASPASPFTITEVKCRLNRATCLLKLQGYAAALRESDAVLACVPVNAKAHYQRAQALEADFRFGAARMAFVAAVHAGPSLHEPRTSLGSLCERVKARPCPPTSSPPS